jgi:phosphoribosylanthranilate isomerase
VLVKICGITRPDDAEAAVAAGADLLGFVFRQGTPRALRAEQVGWVGEIKNVETVGVFLDSPLDEVRRIRDRLELDWVQLHGDEPDSFLETLGSKIIRRVKVVASVDWERVAWLSGRCLPLFDPGAGDGETWPWDVLIDRPEGLRFGLAGGLDPDNVVDAVRTVNPYLVDVSSGVEVSPGIKDHAKVRDFITNVRTSVR